MHPVIFGLTFTRQIADLNQLFALVMLGLVIVTVITYFTTKSIKLVMTGVMAVIAIGFVLFLSQDPIGHLNGLYNAVIDILNG